jgi:hypothetical protein
MNYKASIHGSISIEFIIDRLLSPSHGRKAQPVGWLWARARRGVKTGVHYIASHISPKGQLHNMRPCWTHIDRGITPFSGLIHTGRFHLLKAFIPFNEYKASIHGSITNCTIKFIIDRCKATLNTIDIHRSVEEHPYTGVSQLNSS